MFAVCQYMIDKPYSDQLLGNGDHNTQYICRIEMSGDMQIYTYKCIGQYCVNLSVLIEIIAIIIDEIIFRFIHVEIYYVRACFTFNNLYF